MTDYEGNQVSTALNEQLADEIAKAGNGIYVWGGDRNVVDQLDSQLDKLSKTEFKRSSVPSAASRAFPNCYSNRACPSADRHAASL